MVNANSLMTSIYVFAKKSIYTVQLKTDVLNQEEKRKHRNGHDGRSGVNVQQHVTKVSSHDTENVICLVTVEALALEQT